MPLADFVQVAHNRQYVRLTLCPDAHPYVPIWAGVDRSVSLPVSGSGGVLEAGPCCR